MNKIYRIIHTCVIRMLYKGKIIVDGFLDFSRDTKVRITKGGEIAFGESVSTYNNVHISAIGGKIKIGARVSFNRNCIILCRDAITIGNECIFGPNVCLYDHDHKFGIAGIQKGYKTTPIIIEDNCWIGANVTILRGTHIGSGSVIGAGTVIKGEVPPHSLVTNDRKLIVQSIEER